MIGGGAFACICVGTYMSAKAILPLENRLWDCDFELMRLGEPGGGEWRVTTYLFGAVERWCPLTPSKYCCWLGVTRQSAVLVFWWQKS